MQTILVNLLTYSIVVALIIFITGLVFIKADNKFMKFFVGILCIISISLIIIFDDKYRGYPQDPPLGSHRVQGWEIDEINRSIYLMIIPENSNPINVVIPFDLEKALYLQDAAENYGIYKEMTIHVNNFNNILEYEFNFVKRFEDEPILNNNEITDFEEEVQDTEIENFNYPKPN